MALYTPISSSSVEIFPFIFYFVEKLNTDNLTRNIIDPMCPRQYLCTTYEAPTHNLTIYMSPTLKVRFRFHVPLRYFNIHLISPQYYLSGFFTREGSNEINVCMSWSALSLMNTSCYTLWRRVGACYYGRYCISIS